MKIHQSMKSHRNKEAPGVPIPGRLPALPGGAREPRDPARFPRAAGAGGHAGARVARAGHAPRPAARTRWARSLARRCSSNPRCRSCSTGLERRGLVRRAARRHGPAPLAGRAPRPRGRKRIGPVVAQGAPGGRKPSSGITGCGTSRAFKALLKNLHRRLRTESTLESVAYDRFRSALRGRPPFRGLVRLGQGLRLAEKRRGLLSCPGLRRLGDREGPFPAPRLNMGAQEPKQTACSFPEDAGDGREGPLRHRADAVFAHAGRDSHQV